MAGRWRASRASMAVSSSRYGRSIWGAISGPSSCVWSFKSSLTGASSARAWRPVSISNAVRPKENTSLAGGFAGLEDVSLEDFQGHHALEPQVPGSEHGSERPAAQRAADAVMAKDSSGLKGTLGIDRPVGRRPTGRT